MLSVFAGCDKEPVEQVLLEIDRTNMKMTVGQSQKLNAVLKGIEGDFIWESDAPEVADVDAEEALTSATDKFLNRFSLVEKNGANGDEC